MNIYYVARTAHVYTTAPAETFPITSRIAGPFVKRDHAEDALQRARDNGRDQPSNEEENVSLSITADTLEESDRLRSLLNDIASGAHHNQGEAVRSSLNELKELLSG